MQKIEIDIIINKLKKGKYWDYYKETIKDEVGEEYLDYCIGKKGILEINEINNETGKYKDIKKLLENLSWDKFENLKKEFIDLVFEEINYCPNCGKSPFINTGKLNLKSFDLDHFFPKSIFPYLKFNFYNLIPICPFCNQKIKKTRNVFDYEGNIYNPYFGILEVENEKIKFTNNFNIGDCIKFYGKNDFLSSYVNQGFNDFYKTTEIYFNTNDTFNTFNFIQDKIFKIKDEETRLANKDIDKNWKEYFFKDYYSKKDYLKFSNGKLKKDLIENINL